MRTGKIKALTGLRVIAAMWVVLFHFRPLSREAAPDFSESLAPVLNCGAQGVDLFFVLSGFVLAWNYLDTLGPSFSPQATLRFLWLRLARVWPVYLVTLHIAALWIAGLWLAWLRYRKGIERDLQLRESERRFRDFALASSS